MQNEYVQDLDLPRGFSSKKIELNTAIPPNYIPLCLSAGGKFGIPEKIHVRNFTTSELLDISLFEGRMLLEKTVSALNSIIYEKVDVACWPEKILIELVLNVQSNFFSPTIEDIEFPWNQEDIDWLLKANKKEDIEALKTGIWVPRVSFPMSQIKTIELDSQVKPFVSFSRKGVIKAKFKSYPGFGDTLFLDKLIEEKFGEKDKIYERTRSNLLKKSTLEIKGEDSSSVIVTDEDYLSLQLHEVSKLKFIALASVAMYLVEYDGKNVLDMDFDKKIDIVSSPLFDSGLGKSLNKKFDELKFGIDPEVEVVNPITGEVSKRHFTFQVIPLLQALQSSDSNGYDISYDD